MKISSTVRGLWEEELEAMGLVSQLQVTAIYEISVFIRLWLYSCGERGREMCRNGVDISQRFRAMENLQSRWRKWDARGGFVLIRILDFGIKLKFRNILHFEVLT